jgi:hypothetical protein
MSRIACLALTISLVLWGSSVRAQPRPGMDIPERCVIGGPQGWVMDSPSRAHGLRGEVALCQTMRVLETGQPRMGGPLVSPYIADPVKAMVYLWSEIASLQGDPGFAASVVGVRRVPWSNVVFLRYDNHQNGQAFGGYARVQSVRPVRQGQWIFAITLLTAPIAAFPLADQTIEVIFGRPRTRPPRPPPEAIRQRVEDIQRRSNGNLELDDRVDAYLRE